MYENCRQTNLLVLLVLGKGGVLEVELGVSLHEDRLGLLLAVVQVLVPLANDGSAGGVYLHVGVVLRGRTGGEGVREVLADVRAAEDHVDGIRRGRGVTLPRILRGRVCVLFIYFRGGVDRGWACADE